MKNYLVTGAAGFIGSAVAKELVSQGHCVVSIDNLSTGKEINIPDGVLFIEGDCSDPEIFPEIPNKKFDAIIHIAGQSSGEISFDDPIYDVKTNTNSTLLLLDYALDNKCERFIYAGTMSVYGIQSDAPVSENAVCQPTSFYGVGKLASEHYMYIYRQFGLKTTSLRLFNVYGPGQNLTNLRQGMVSIFLAQMYDQGLIQIKGSQDRFRDFVYLDDVVKAFMECLKNKDSYNQSINIGTGVRTTVKDLVNMIIEIHDKPVKIEYGSNTPGDVHGIYANIDKMKSILKINDPVTLNSGLRKMMKWIENTKHN